MRGLAVLLGVAGVAGVAYAVKKKRDNELVTGAAPVGPTVDVYRVLVRRFAMDPAQPKVPLPICSYVKIAELRYPHDEATARVALAGMRGKYENPPGTLVSLVVTTTDLVTGKNSADVVLYESAPRWPEGPCPVIPGD